MSTARLFFALWPDPATRRRLGKTSRPAVRRCGGRPVPERNLHLTLAFLGNVPTELLPVIRQAAAGLEPPALELELDRFGHFPRARVAWLGLSDPPPALATFAAQLWAALEPVGLEVEHRPFHPHVTIARKIQRPPDVEVSRAVQWTVRSFELMRSVTASAGARYTLDQGFPQGSSNEP